MIIGQVRDGKSPATVLAAELVTGEKVLAREFDPRMRVTDPNIMPQAHHGRDLHDDPDAVDFTAVLLQDFDLVLVDHPHCPLPSHDLEGLVGRIQ